ncbi:glutamine synthetase family protein [Niveispirillum cyanobacteriorum]|uniref:Glutamine synthetase n=1 Tax=Niveispirillum cyanobacteriorum TaxID=1612173 RepID=A0A2K9NJU5_9PROT|nr:glutamine synthetase family protein [Niveispirillum cyanobacteriorum]AUN33333.1 glutamine synthetase [Niveispirillum cyanobacteriorum]GGE49605.1 glutamine synthetase [Niveispirillum cyanobacteriorum]
MTTRIGEWVEAEAFLAAHPDVEAVDIVLTDANGIGRGKIIRRHEVEALYKQGRHLPSSILGLDVTGEDVEETGLVWSVGDADLRAWPIAGTLVLLPWTSPRRAQVLVSLYHLDGRPHGADPRHAMAAQIDAMATDGRYPAGAFELEFYLLDAEPGPDGRPCPAAMALDGRRHGQVQVYGLDDLDGMQPFFGPVYQAAKAQGLPLETLISEYAPGQYELTLHYRRDLLRAADDLVMLKRLVRAMARRQGMVACFMAKPFAAQAGSGMHLHVSLNDRQGHNLFSEDEGAVCPNPQLLHAIGGLAATMGDGMLAFAPHANSWRRYVAKLYAPVQPTWGVNDRSVALRIPAGPVTDRRIEHRLAGVDANPYLVGATVLAGMQRGMAHTIDPGPAAEYQGFTQETPFARAMPGDWRAAIAQAQGSDFLKDALGADLHRSFIAIKRAELFRVAGYIPDIDYQLYLY